MSIESKTLDWNEYKKAANDVVGEGCVLLENNNSVLPLKKGDRVSVFGRMFFHYYKSGTGSGGMVNVSKVYGLIDGFKEAGIEINEELYKVYEKWEETHLFNPGEGWGTEPWSQEEMPVSDEDVRRASEKTDTAIIVIGRTAGEDKDFTDEEGAFRLSSVEEDMMKKVCSAFDKTVVLLNVGAVPDLSFIDKYSPSATLIIWQGGMMGGIATAQILTGDINPSGKLPDTVAGEIADYGSSANFGNPERNYYAEDIYVGYRYFETFAKEKIRFPFGYGLSYTEFNIATGEVSVDYENKEFTIESIVGNIGEFSGKEVVQVYVGAPRGKLGKPSKVLGGFCKTKLLAPGEEERVVITVPFGNFASYDDKAVTEYPYGFLLEEGEYSVFLGNNSSDAEKVYSFELSKDVLIEQCESSLGPVLPFKRMTQGELLESGNYKIEYEETPLYGLNEDDKRAARIPSQLQPSESDSYRLSDVKSGRITMEQFISGLSDEDLATIVRGEGMGSTLVTPGTAAAFGGVSERLRAKGIPAVCCDDGPSGMRLDSGAKAFSLPGGVMIAATFNPEIVTSLYGFLALEMISNKVDVLLGPGVNIHRHPLNGRNFEYFSEDPLLTGIMSEAMLKGLKENGVSGTVKHFCGNNQELERRTNDSVISERALREIYLKPFEISVRSGYCDSIMTTYGQVNGRWTSGNYDLNTAILRDEWGFRGIVMTDWWAYINERGGEKSVNDTATMVKAGNDLYMVVDKSEDNTAGDNTIEMLGKGRISRAELQRSAMYICEVVMKSPAFRRLNGECEDIEIINRDAEDVEFDFDNVEYIHIDNQFEMSLTDKDSVAGTNYYIPLQFEELGEYNVTITGSSTRSPLAQLPCTIFFMGTPQATFTFNGTEGRTVSISKKMFCFNKISMFRLYVATNGLKLEKINIERLNTSE